jgi:hypothetical protein
MEFLGSTAKPLTPSRCPPAEFASGSTAQSTWSVCTPHYVAGVHARAAIYRTKYASALSDPSITVAPTCGAGSKLLVWEKQLLAATGGRDEAGRLVNATSNE